MPGISKTAKLHMRYGTLSVIVGREVHDGIDHSFLPFSNRGYALDFDASFFSIG